MEFQFLIMLLFSVKESKLKEILLEIDSRFDDCQLL